MTDGTKKSGGGSILERAARANTGQPPEADAPNSLLERAAKAAAAQPADMGLTPPGTTITAQRGPSYAQRMAEAPEAPRAAEADPITGRGGRRGTIDFDVLRERGFVVPDAPTTATAEEFRLVKRQLLANALARGPNSIRNGNLILVGSSLPSEGKTFCAINLALSIASERDLTVLLVDADFPKPDVVARLGLEAGPGLIDIIEDRSIDIGDCLIRTQIPNFTVLPAGRQSHLTTELLASERMEDLIDEIARRYTDRIIIFDSPPALVSSAASVLATHVGQVLFVVQAEATRESELREGLALMSGCPNVQLLLNRSRFNAGGRRFGSYYAYGY